MSRSSNINLIVRDDGIELLLCFAQSGNVVKNDFRFLVLLRSFCNSYLDGVDNSQRTVAVINDFHSIIHTRNHNCGHLRRIVAIYGFCAAAPDKQSALDGHIVQHNFTIRCAAADDEVAIHGQVFQLYIVGADQDAAFNILVISTLGHNVSANDICKNLCKFCAGDVIQRSKDFAAAVNVVCTDHCPDVRQRPVGNLAAVGKCRQVCFGIRIVVQFQRAGNDRHSLLP